MRFQKIILFGKSMVSKLGQIHRHFLLDLHPLKKTWLCILEPAQQGHGGRRRHKWFGISRLLIPSPPPPLRSEIQGLVAPARKCFGISRIFEIWPTSRGCNFVASDPFGMTRRLKWSYGSNSLISVVYDNPWPAYTTPIRNRKIVFLENEHSPPHHYYS